MEGRLLLKNCAIFSPDGRVRDRMAVVIDGGKIAAVEPDASIPVRPGDWSASCEGRLVTPGLIDCHTHLVNAQLRPQSGEMLLRAARDRHALQRHLDAQLTAADVEVLTAFAIGKALRAGVTMAVEHLHCPNEPGPALEAQARVAERMGIRLSNSHATNSLGGEEAATRGFEANAAYAKAMKGHPLVRPALGFHASFSSEDSLLRRIGQAREELGVGVTFHLAESQDDLTFTFSRHSQRIVPRLEAFGLLGPGAVAAHARAVDRSESGRLSRSRTLIALGPRFNLVAEPVGGGFEAVIAHQNLLGLGTSGVGLLWGELICAFTGIIQIARAGRLLDPDGFMSQLLFGGPSELCSLLYGAPSGIVEAGALADLVVYDHVPAQEDAGGLAPHLLMQLGSVRPAWVIANGRVVVREGQLLGHDYMELARAAARTLESLWKRAGTQAS
ncbi:MAG TPA: amidohydrolase family protein [Myxococcaceae bacterium]|jgi:cytosine/adenosine deaminase-related metal-dependent hydrolase